jgi:hypothetical protein
LRVQGSLGYIVRRCLKKKKNLYTNVCKVHKHPKPEKTQYPSQDQRIRELQLSNKKKNEVLIHTRWMKPNCTSVNEKGKLEGMAQVVENLTKKDEALSSVPSTK